MKPQEKNLFVIAYLSLALIIFAIIGAVMNPAAADSALLVLIVGMGGLGVALYEVGRKPAFEAVSDSRFILRRPYPLSDRFGDLWRAIDDGFRAFKRKHPLAYLLINLVGIFAFLASVTLLMVAFDPTYDPGV